MSHGESSRQPAEIRIGCATCGVASGALPVKEALEDALQKGRAGARVKAVGCQGMCHNEPLVELVAADGRTRLYRDMTPGLARRVVQEHVPSAGWASRAAALFDRAADWALKDSAWEPLDEREVDVARGPAAAYLAKQKRIVLANCGRIDPLDVEEYRAQGGYQALEKCLREMTPGDVVETVRRSGLRGRGGAGYDTAAKWDASRRAPGPKKYVVCNGDEGDPGAFMDRLALESDPHKVIEGMAITAYAIGADEGYLYIRAEYPLAVRVAEHAIRAAGERGYLGDHVLGTAFSLHLHVMQGAGAFVCGEETALIASIEGRRGMPRLRPPYPAESGLWGKPTNVNNVETYACIPWIVANGPDAFAALGTEKSKGTKVFALAGRIRRPGLIEVPMGITIGEIVEDIGGGIRDGRQFKAVQIGGPSGGCLPARLGDTRIDFEELNKYGAIMGSGGLVVLDDTDCMVDIARFFLQFTQNESCGKCTFCRIGTKRMLEILDRLCEGQGKRGDLERLEELADRVRRTSLCGLGQTAPNPVLTTLRYFRDEYEAHVEGRCPALKCQALTTYRITDACIGCTLCAQHCPVDAIEIKPYEQHEIDAQKCVRCGTCRSVCPTDAVEIIS